jgi:hypothetical protein
VVQRVPIIKVVENCALCYDENYNIKITEILEYTKFVFKILVEVIKGCCILQI